MGSWKQEETRIFYKYFSNGPELIENWRKIDLINDILRFTSTRRLQSQSCSQIKHRHKCVINPKINRANFGFENLRTFLNKIENIRSVESFFVFSIINDKNVSVILDNPGSFPDRIIRGHVTESRLNSFWNSWIHRNFTT